MFTANNSCSSYIEVILSMLPLYKVTPAISGLGVGWKTKKNGNRRRAPCHCNSCCDSRKRHTVSLFSSKSTEEYLGGYYCCSLSKSMAKKKQDKTGEKAKMDVDSLLNTPDMKCDSTLASTWCLRGYYSKMAPATVKRNIIHHPKYLNCVMQKENSLDRINQHGLFKGRLQFYSSTLTISISQPSF